MMELSGWMPAFNQLKEKSKEQNCSAASYDRLLFVLVFQQSEGGGGRKKKDEYILASKFHNSVTLVDVNVHY